MIDELTECLASGPRRATPRTEWMELASTAPDPVKPLLRALAEHETPYLAFGWREIYGDDCETFEGVVSSHRITDPPFDPARSVHLGATGGGEIVFGLAWTPAAVSFVEIDLEAPVRVRTYGPDAYFTYLKAHEIEKCAELESEVGRTLVAIAAALGDPIT
jgi:hypothetical protein